MCRLREFSDFQEIRPAAGTQKKKIGPTLIVVPEEGPDYATEFSPPPRYSTRVPSSSSVARVARSSARTAAMGGSASRGNPSVATWRVESPAVRSFGRRVALGTPARGASSWIIPLRRRSPRIIVPPRFNFHSNPEPRPRRRSAFASSSFRQKAGRLDHFARAILFATCSASIAYASHLMRQLRFFIWRLGRDGFGGPASGPQ